MRTTVDLPEDMLRAAKGLAARSGRTLSQVVGDALRAAFAQADDARKHKPRPLPTFDGGGLQPGVDLDSSAALLELMEQRG